MADTVRCQMCGELSPPEAEVCWFCNARLKPLIAGVSGDAKPFPPEIPQAARDIPSEAKPLEPGEFSLSISVGSEPVSEPTEVEDNSLDWLADIRSGAKMDTSSLQPLDETGVHPQTGSLEAGTKTTEGHGSDWLQRLEGAEGDHPQGTPATLPVAERPGEPIVGQESEQQPQDFPEEEVGVSSPETDLAAWLAELDGGGEENPTVSELADVGVADEAELSAWLKQVAGEDPAVPKTEEIVEAEAEKLPNWLKSIDEGQPSASETGTNIEAEKETSTETAAETQPDWLRGINEETFPVSEVEIRVEAELDELPDRLKSVEEQPQVMEAEPTIEATVEEVKSCDWLAGNNEEQPPISEAEILAMACIKEAVLPDTLAGINAVEPLHAEVGVTEEPAILREAASPFESDMKPAWLENLLLAGEDKKPGSPLQSGEATPGELTPAELPGWLEAMRPDVEINPAEHTFVPTSSIMESSGPLAGLDGVLPPQSVAAQVGKSPTPTLKMHLSRRQKEHVALLSKMLATENEATPVNLPEAVVSQRLVRWGIAIIIFFASFLPIVAGSQQMPLPIPPYEIQQVNQLVGGLAPGTPVLLAFDYEPGLSGEMDAAASAVVDHMMVRGASLALVSTSPTGPILAERFVQKIQVGHRYMAGQQYLNLGYIPGGAAGLMSFAGYPQRTLPYTIDGKRAWGIAPLQNIQKLSDFSLVVVIVDDPETARNWVEQVQPYLGITPLVIVVSAQAEPMVRPYYEGNPRQIQGMIVGLLGGSAYEHMTGHEGLGRAYWDAFGIDLLLAVAIILVGAIVSFILLALDWRNLAKADTTANMGGKSKGIREHA